jgi:hypothetical protein
MCLAYFPDGVSSWAQAREGRGVSPPPERIVLMMNPICPLNQKPLPHMLVVLMTLIWKMLMLSLILKHTLALSRDGQGILIKRLARYVLMRKKRTPRLHNFELRYNMMHSMVT